MKEESSGLRSLLLAPLILLLMLLIAAAIGAYWVLHRGLPEREGTVSLPFLSAPVTVYWDIWGVPHLDGASGEDLAGVLGYLHANDRMTQMELGRRLVAGRLAEVAGEAALDSDIEMRTLRLRRAAEQMWETSDPEAKRWLTAYAAGVNAWLEGRGRDLPPGLGILRILPEPWTPADSLGFTLLMAYDLSFWQGRPEETRFEWLRDHGVDGVRDLIGEPELHLPPEILEMAERQQPTAGEPAPTTEVAGEASGEVVDPPERVEADGPPGSNNWALGASRSGEAGPLVANDPHLGFQLPGIWYQVRMRAPDYEAVGMSLPGAPGVVIGQSPRLGWALTNLMLDDHDLFFEQVDDAGRSVRRGEEWLAMTVEEQTIGVRDGRSRRLELLETDHGPLLPADENRDLPARSLAWTAYLAADPVGGLLRLARASSVEEVPEAIEGFVCPAQNLVVADLDGGLLQTVLGELPDRIMGDGRLPSPGWDPAYGWNEATEPLSKPVVLKPESDLLITANHDTRPPDFEGKLTGDFDLPSRADRIAELLAARERWRAAELGRVQLDIRSLYAERLVDLAGDEYRGGAGRAYSALATWDGRFQTAGPAALFALFERYLVEGIFADDVVLGNVSWMQRRHWLTRILGGEMDERWFDDAPTPRQEGRHEVVAEALERAWVEGIERWEDDVSLWSYGDLHPLLLRHPLDSLPVVGEWFARGPVPAVGAASTVLVAGGSWRGASRPVSFGPSMRWISVVGDPDRSLAILPGGQSGHPYDPHYDDQLALYFEGRMRPVSWRQQTVEAASTGEQRFIP